MFRSWSISSLLKLWAFATIFAILVISSVAIYTNNLFSDSQKQLVDKVLPIENAIRKINSLASLFITRQKQVIASRSLESINLLIPRTELESQFSTQLEQIALTVERNSDNKIVADLQADYSEFLLVDTELLQLITQQHMLRKQLQKETSHVSLLQSAIHNDVEAISGRIKLQHSLNKRSMTRQASKELDSEAELIEQIKHQETVDRLSQEIRLNVLNISLLTQKLLLSNNPDMLLNIKDNNIQQYQSELFRNIRFLEKKLNNTELLALTKSLDKKIVLLIQAVTQGDSSVYKLRLKQIKLNHLLSEGQHQSILILHKIEAELDTLASLVTDHSLNTVKKSSLIVEQGLWLVILLSLGIIFGMLGFILSISRRINEPLSELSSAMKALTSSLFETRIGVVSGKSEFAVIAKDFNLFAANTQRLIADLADAKNTLESREQYLSTILNGVPEAVLTLSPDGTIRSSNPAAEEVFKADSATLMGLKLNYFLAEEFRDMPFNLISSNLAESPELKGRNYKNQPFSMWLSLNHASNFKEELWVCVIADVTAWKKVEHNLKTTSSELDAIFENAMVGIALIKNRTLSRVNSKFEQLFATDRSMVEGQSTKILYPSDDIFAQLGEDAYSTLATGESFVQDVRLTRQNGENFWGTMSGKALDVNDPHAGSIWLFEDITVQRENDEKLRLLASSDALTGLPNRSVFNDRLEHAIHKAYRQSTRLAVCFLDLDHFKHINDSLGHKAGDTLLCEVAERLKACIREGDTVARLGGDEFTIILEDIKSARHVATVANKVLDAIGLNYELDGVEVNISPSIGISLYPADGRDVDLLVRNADAAMYHAKNTGRNNFQFYSGEMNAQAAKRLAMETSLRRAIDNDEFYLHFQPQVELVSGRITGAEALLRWNNDKWGGNVSPAEFVPILEDIGLISIVGQNVIKQAIEAYLELKDRLEPDFRMAVNLSGRQFQGGQLAHFIEEQLLTSGMSPENLELEITESILMDDTDLAITTLNLLSGVGITLAIDDFGTGYSSLSYLKRFPLNVLKIDRSFIRDVNQDEDDAAIVMAILAMSHRLNFEVIAEGVETEEQLAFLEDNDCDRVQGYYFSKPLPLEAFKEFIDHNSVKLAE